MSTWTAFAKEQPPEGHGPIYITDGARVSFVQRAVLPATEAPRLVLAEPEAVPLNLTPQVAAPTHWAVTLPGLPKVKDEDRPEVFEGGPPVDRKPDEEIKAPVQEAGDAAIKVKVVNDPLDHDGNGRQGGTK